MDLLTIEFYACVTQLSPESERHSINQTLLFLVTCMESQAKFTVI